MHSSVARSARRRLAAVAAAVMASCVAGAVAAQPASCPKMDTVKVQEYTGYIVNLTAGATTTPVVTLAASTCNASVKDAIPTYFAEDHPVSPGSSGTRSFATDQRGTVFQDNSGLGPVMTTASIVTPLPATTTPIQ